MTASKVIARLLYWQPHLFEALPLIRERCVLATRVGIDVLARFGIPAEPRPVVAMVCNLPYERFRVRIKDLPLEDAKQVPLPPDGWSVLAGLPPGPDDPPSRPARWYGHLVVYLPTREQMLDLDFQAFNRPEKGLIVPPALLARWPAGDDMTRVIGAEIPGQPVIATYERNDDNQGYVDGPDWRSEREFIVETVGAIERAIRKGGPTP